MLSPLGKKQVQSLGLALKDEQVSAIYSSPLKRALETAKNIATYHNNLKVQIEHDLRELEVGELEGVNIVDLGTDFSLFLLQWREGEGTEKLPGGESLADLQNRAWSAVQRIIAKNQGNIVLVCHYFVILTIICAALGLPPKGIRRFRVGVGSISTLDFKNGVPCLASLGDTCHLR